MKRNIVTLDCGNSGAKAVVWHGDDVVGRLRHDGPLTTAFLDRLRAFCADSIDGVAACTVTGWPEGFPQALGILAPEVLVLDACTPVPLEVDYDRSRLGADRLAAAIGARYLTGCDNILVVDAGTAVTYDAVIGGRYCGGSIAPGVKLRLDALHVHTAALPCPATPAGQCVFPARSTVPALEAGALLGVVAEIEYYHRRMPGDTLVVIAGGDTPAILANNPSVPVADTDPGLLIPTGLKCIYHYNHHDLTT